MYRILKWDLKVAVISLAVTILLLVSMITVSINSVGKRIDDIKNDYDAIVNAEYGTVVKIKSTFLDDKNVFVIKRVDDNGDFITAIGNTYYGEMLKIDLEKDRDFELRRKELTISSTIWALLLSISFGLIVYIGIIYLKPIVDDML